VAESEADSRGGLPAAREKEMKHEAKPVSLHSREGIALLFALAVVLLIGLLSFRSSTAFGRHTDQMEVTQRVVSGINALISSLTAAETGQRGFLLTGEDRYLGPYRQARADIPAQLKSLGTLSANHPEQAERIERLNPLVDEKLGELAQTVELRQNEGIDAALAVVRTDRGRAVMDQVRGICLEIQTAASERLTQYSEQARRSQREGSLISILGGVSLFLLLLVATITIQKGAGRRKILIGELQQSERRLEDAAAEAQAANRAKSTFLSTMSHEIRTPMNAILGYAQLMLRDPDLGADAKANLKIIGRSGEHLLGLINEVLDMSKIEAGRMDLNPTTFNLTSLVGDLASMFRLRAEAKGLQFEALVDGESAPYVVADEGKLRQALINLLGNAIKFTARGHIRLHVTLTLVTLDHVTLEHLGLDNEKANRLWLSARVEDTGAGISDEEQGKLFEPFSQIRRGLYGQEGTGLGLAISRKYARLMGGDITVTSSPGTGSIFRLEIPLERGDAGVAVRRSDSRRVIGIRAGPEVPRILVVDDHPEGRDWLMKLLGSIGFSIRGADNGEAAIRDWEEWNPHLILMDVHMPVMDGLEATRRIKASPWGKETVIIALTASALHDDRLTVSQSGVDDFVMKPCREGELLDKIRAFLKIAYRYEESDETDRQPVAGVAALSAERLGPVPRELLEELRNATLSGNKRLLDKLILKAPETSAKALQELADGYEYDALTRLLEEACRG
jgi:signal transduction histidine kinase/DNA-binding response OmpR family regulator